MFKKALALDSKLFLKEKRIRAKRPSEYWLLFLKKLVLIKHREGYSPALWLYLIPVGILIVLLVNLFAGDADTDLSGGFIGLVFSIFIITIIVAIASGFRKRAFVDPNVFDHLAKFIVKIKGDTRKNLIGIELDLSKIEDEANAISIKPLGLKETRQTKYAAYQLERYQANLRLKDDSFCSASLYQMSLKTTTTKRRSSGKTKTKSKHKHKFYYILALKLDAAAYQVMETNKLTGFKDTYEITNQTENGFHMVKLKLKKKLEYLPIEITPQQKGAPSIFVQMMDFLFEKKIITTANPLPTP